jgi:hypothetical protein
LFAARFEIKFGSAVNMFNTNTVDLGLLVTDRGFIFAIWLFK